MLDTGNQLINLYYVYNVFIYEYFKSTRRLLCFAFNKWIYYTVVKNNDVIVVTWMKLRKDD